MAKGALSRIREELVKEQLPLDKLSNLNINISGCPNSCGQHKAADIGFYGRVGRNSRMYPSYGIGAGAVVGNNESRLAEPVDEINARDLPEFITSLLKIYSSQQHKYKSFAEYLDDRGKKDIIELSGKFRNIPDWEDDKNYYFDWGSDQVFSLVGKGVGECSAGIFDMIDVDMNTIRRKQGEIRDTKDIASINELLNDIIFCAARMLLVTRGVEPKNTNEVYDGFIEQFIKVNLVRDEYLNIIKISKDGNPYNFIDEKDTIYDLAKDVIELYNGMDDSLRFDIPEDVKQKDISKLKPIFEPVLKKDYRGVACPMNFVKTKIDLAILKSGDMLEVLLDDGEPIENVPGSVKMEGHKIIRQNKIDNYWSVIIEKR
jgi:sulfite reductase (ferredoxin)